MQILFLNIMCMNSQTVDLELRKCIFIDSSLLCVEIPKPGFKALCLVVMLNKYSPVQVFYFLNKNIFYNHLVVFD